MPRRPHPRYDQRRRAWVTNAGGRLKTLVSGPEDAATEAEAWREFYAQFLMSRFVRNHWIHLALS